ncbi:hypothetical protein HPB50_019713 [Hyalomma asiaticum]|uniref:Uncharacterized protein n=1 Tax=Hyalomma asiaticum TaxID=266040 RepID=A0ACB7S7Y5_HYAAI|nr:hypothetical protein HPB50_019713 [Hyalomma asiaticum]
MKRASFLPKPSGAFKRQNVRPAEHCSDCEASQSALTGVTQCAVEGPVVPNQFSYRLRAVEFSMCDISARMHCLAERRSKIGQTVTGKYANAMRVSNSIAAATARPTFFRFICLETRAPNLRQTVPKGDAASVRVVRSTPGKKRRNAPVAVASVSTVRD